MSSHVSLYQGMRFSICVPITINKLLDTQMGLARETGNDKQTMYYVFVIKTRDNSVYHVNSKITRKEISKLFSCG